MTRVPGAAWLGLPGACLVALGAIVAATPLGAQVATHSLAEDAATLVVEVTDIDAQGGQVLVSLCNTEDYEATSCQHRQRAPASVGTTRVEFDPVPPGIYAVKAVHDANRSGGLDKNIMGIPTEGYGFSNDPGAIFGPPTFAEAAVELRSGKQTVSIDLIHLLSGDFGAQDDRSPK